MYNGGEMKDIVLLVGRVLIVPIFWVAIYDDITGFARQMAGMAQHGMPFTGFLLICAIILTLLGALFILLGLWTRLGIAMLIIFLIPASLIFHLNWATSGALIQFSKNIAIIGGLLFLWYSGPGRIAVRR
jgi:putative oxidoreductase